MKMEPNLNIGLIRKHIRLHSSQTVYLFFCQLGKDIRRNSKVFIGISFTGFVLNQHFAYEFWLKMRKDLMSLEEILLLGKRQSR